jgi:hypothetical protein
MAGAATPRPFSPSRRTHGLPRMENTGSLASENGCCRKPGFRNEVFSETGLPVYGVLGNSVGYKEAESNLDPARFEQRGCQTYDGIEKIRC